MNDSFPVDCVYDVIFLLDLIVDIVSFLFCINYFICCVFLRLLRNVRCYARVCKFVDIMPALHRVLSSFT